jgi:hypothetical protein
MDSNQPFKPFPLGCSLIAALGGLLFGFDAAVISGTTEALKEKFQLSEGMLGFTVASALIGTIIGSMAGGGIKGGTVYGEIDDFSVTTQVV